MCLEAIHLTPVETLSTGLTKWNSLSFLISRVFWASNSGSACSIFFETASPSPSLSWEPPKWPESVVIGPAAELLSCVSKIQEKRVCFADYTMSLPINRKILILNANLIQKININMGKFTFKILHYEPLWCRGLDTPTRGPANLNLSSVELTWNQASKVWCSSHPRDRLGDSKMWIGQRLDHEKWNPCLWGLLVHCPLPG